MRHVKHHAMHLLMCAPMLVIPIIAIAAGTSVAVLLPVVMCVAMMAMMMGGMHADRGATADSAMSRWPLHRGLRLRRPAKLARQDALVVVRNGYHPAVVEARADTPLRLRFRRDESAPCSETVLLPELGRFADLPEGETVTIDCGTLEPGEYDFSCPHGAVHGRLVIQ